MDDAGALRDRLRSCLEAILDLEEGFRRLGQEAFLREELDMVKVYAGQVDALPLDEEDVSRLESLTTRVLAQCHRAGVRFSRQRQVLQ